METPLLARFDLKELICCSEMEKLEICPLLAASVETDVELSVGEEKPFRVLDVQMEVICYSVMEKLHQVDMCLKQLAYGSLDGELWTGAIGCSELKLPI